MSEALGPVADGADPAAIIQGVGEVVRRQRKALSMSMDQLAQKAGVSIGLVSGLERGRGNPSFNALVQVAHALNLPVASLLSPTDTVNPVVRAGARRSLDLHGHGEVDARHELLTASLDQTLEAVCVTAPPGYDTSATPFQHPGEEFGIVLSGRHEVYLDGHCYELGPGDSISYPSSKAHWYRNPGPEPVTAIWVITPPTF
jgi:transcriptional regulator with XRE-family HTH domain